MDPVRSRVPDDRQTRFWENRNKQQPNVAALQQQNAQLLQQNQAQLALVNAQRSPQNADVLKDLTIILKTRFFHQVKFLNADELITEGTFKIIEMYTKAKKWSPEKIASAVLTYQGPLSTVLCDFRSYKQSQLREAVLNYARYENEDPVAGAVVPDDAAAENAAAGNNENAVAVADNQAFDNRARGPVFKGGPHYLNTRPLFTPELMYKCMTR